MSKKDDSPQCLRPLACCTSAAALRSRHEGPCYLPKRTALRSLEQPKAAGKKRVRFLVQKPFGEAIKRGAKRLDLSVSQFVERAIREKLPVAEKAAQIVSSGNPSAIAAVDRGLATIEQLPRNATSAQIRAAKRKLRSIAAGVTPSKKQRVRQSKTSRPIVHPVATPVPADHPQALRTFWHRNVAPARWFDPQKDPRHSVTSGRV